MVVSYQLSVKPSGGRKDLIHHSLLWADNR